MRLFRLLASLAPEDATVASALREIGLLELLGVSDVHQTCRVRQRDWAK